MQVGTERQAGSELHAWRQFLARSTLWLGVLLLGSAAICWVAANWQDMTKVQRFAGTQGLLAISALAAAWAGLRLRGKPGVRRSVPGALLALAGILLGALLALLGQTYQTGADTWELFAWWAVLLLPWALASASQAVWLLWALVLNMAVALWLGERVFTWFAILDGTGLPNLIMAALNLTLLLGWELTARRWRASTMIGPRVLAAIAISALVLSLMFGDFLVRGVGSLNGIAWLAATLGLGFYYQRGRLDLVILAMLAAGVICVSLRVVGEWLLRLEPGVWAALPLAALLMAEAVLAARWLRGLAAGPQAAVAAADAEPAAASAGNAVEPGDSGAAVAQLAPVATPHAEPPWYVQCLLGLSAWLATLLLLVFVAFSGIVTSDEGALLQTVKSNAERLLELTNQLLEFRKADSGFTQLKMKAGDIVGFSRTVFDKFAGAAARADVDFRFDSAEDYIQLYFDPHYMEIVLSNLLSNALKFAAGGTVCMRVSTGAEGIVDIRVYDDGIGIPVESQEKIFTKFYRAGNGNGRQGGSGIGLAYARQLVELHHGKLQFYSRNDSDTRETCFIITLKSGRAHFNAGDQVID